MHERRADKLYGLIAAQPRNAYELAQEMWEAWPSRRPF